MPFPYKPLIPQTVGEIMDHLAMMMLSAPTMEDELGTFDRNVETVFSELNQGLAIVRQNLGEDRYIRLIAMSDQTRRHFEADPRDANGEARAGRTLIRQMRDLLVASLRG